MYDLEAFYGPNAGYVLELYERYRQNPASIDAASRAIFDTWSPEDQLTAEQVATTGIAPIEVSQIVAASALAHAIRSRGHLGAHLDPLLEVRQYRFGQPIFFRRHLQIRVRILVLHRGQQHAFLRLAGYDGRFPRLAAGGGPFQ